MKNRLLPLLLLLSTLSVAHAKDTIEDGRMWLTLSHDYHINDKWRLNLHLQPRWREEGREFDQIIYRPGIYYKVNSALSLGVGYGYILTHLLNSGNTHEQRLWEDVLYQTNLTENIKFLSRSRLEQRHLESYSDIAHRFRQMVRFSVPTRLMNGLSAVFYNEYFINMNDASWGVHKGFDQNRAFLGVNYTWSKHINADFGYLNQYVNRPTVDAENHVLTITINTQF
jgi:long-subunit fatty acid transport protein